METGHKNCPDCGDCHNCLANLERWGDVDGREARMIELATRLSHSNHAWLRGEPGLTVEERVAYAEELTLLRSAK